MRLALALAALLPAAVAAQTADYFPLGESDTWTYGSVLEPPNAPPDTTLDAPVTVRGTTTVRDTVYTLAAFPGRWSDTLRVDGEGRVWARIDGRDQLYLDVTRPDGGTYSVTRDGDVYEVTVQRGLEATTPAGRFEDVVVFSFEIPGTLDSGVSLALAPDVGLVRASGPLSGYRELFEARVGGILILDGADGPSEAALRVHPNPVVSLLTVEVPAGDRRRVEVLDARGRTVAVLFDGRCASACRATWDARGAASGVYVVRATGGREAATRTVVRVR